MKRLFSLMNSLAPVYDRMSLHPNRVHVERLTIELGAAGFLLHLALVFLSRSLPHPPALVAAIGQNYLSAIDTPFTFILLYEVLVMIAAIPQSWVQSVANQFEIVSLIFARGFFKSIAAIDDLERFRHPTVEMLPIATNACASLLMFLFVTVFKHIALKRRRMEAATGQLADNRVLIAQKKSIALALMVYLISLTLYTLAEFGRDCLRVISHELVPELHLQTSFYADVFIFMIFTDVLILILSLAQSDRYELVFRNAAFVISTTLIRFSLTSEPLYAAPLALSGIIFGILTLLIYSYSSKVHMRYQGSARSVERWQRK